MKNIEQGGLVREDTNHGKGIATLPKYRKLAQSLFGLLFQYALQYIGLPLPIIVAFVRRDNQKMLSIFQRYYGWNFMDACTTYMKDMFYFGYKALK